MTPKLLKNLLTLCKNINKRVDLWFYTLLIISLLIKNELVHHLQWVYNWYFVQTFNDYNRFIL